MPRSRNGVARRGRRASGVGSGPSRSTSETDDTAEGDTDREREQGRLRIGRRPERRQPERDGGAADRQRGLPDAEGKPSLADVEPVHHRPAARGVDGRAETAREEEQREQRGERRDEGRRREAGAGEARGLPAPPARRSGR